MQQKRRSRAKKKRRKALPHCDFFRRDSDLFRRAADLLSVKKSSPFPQPSRDKIAEPFPGEHTRFLFPLMRYSEKRHMTQPPCSPKQQLYKGKPGTTLVCPACQQAMQGIPYPYGIGLLTLPIHYDPLWMKSHLRILRSDRIFPRRSTSR
jgi:hypothetical protein